MNKQKNPSPKNELNKRWRDEMERKKIEGRKKTENEKRISTYKRFLIWRNLHSSYVRTHTLSRGNNEEKCTIYNDDSRWIVKNIVPSHGMYVVRYYSTELDVNAIAVRRRFTTDSTQTHTHTHSVSFRTAFILCHINATWQRWNDE